ncbi:MAG: pirin family protein [Chloroflexi bacterium]|nr:pirin family protein [Chloroflexota bacterium]
MPAVYVEDVTSLPRIPVLTDGGIADRPVNSIINAPRFLEGEGFEVRRAFAELDLRLADPFLLLDHMGAVEYSPGEAKGAPDHPHRGFETVTYMLDGELEHRDSNGGGGLITDGATQWMTAGAGIVHSEMPTELIVAKGGLFHGVQLWVNLPSAQKWTPPQYQDLEADSSVLLASEDGGAMVRLIAGDLAGHKGPGSTHTPITYAHVSISPGARLQVPWPTNYNALVYVLAGEGAVGPERQPIHEGQLAVLGSGDQISVYCEPKQDNGLPRMEALLLGGMPIREQIAWHGPFVMNTRDELYQAINDYHAGRMGSIPAKHAGD